MNRAISKTKVASYVLSGMVLSVPLLFAHASQELPNPLGVSSITELFGKVINVMIQIGVPLAVLAIIYAGFKYVTAFGDEKKVSEAHQMLLWSAVGSAVLLGAKVIITAIEGTVRQLG